MSQPDAEETARSWLAPAGPGRAEQKVRGSRFLADVRPAASAEEAERHLQDLRQEFPRATHHCWGWRLWRDGEVRERAGDDGEPSGTGGQPILRALQAGDMDHASCVVVRWFGGTRLGAGPLARAYRDAAAAAVEAAGTVRMQMMQVLRLQFPHASSGDVRRALARLTGRIVDEDHGAQAVLRYSIRPSQTGRVLAALADASRGKGTVFDLGQVAERETP